MKKALFKNLPRVVLDSVDLIEFDLGTDDHARYNVFFLTPNINKSISESGMQAFLDVDSNTGFPGIQQHKIKRHGLRLFFQEVNTLIQNGIEKTDRALVQDYNEVILEYWDEAQFYESGTLSIIGNNGVKLGKVLELPSDSPSNGNKLFYIEGYQDSFTVMSPSGTGVWTQSLNLTRGIEAKVLETGRLSSETNPNDFIGDFTRNG